MTSGGNANNEPCVFPFVYKSKTYQQCIFEPIVGNLNNKRWCCATSDCDKELKWGFCPGYYHYYLLIFTYFFIYFINYFSFQNISEATAPLISNDCVKPGYKSLDKGVNCFKLVTDNKLTWRDADLYCKNDKGRLVTIRDGFEQSFVRLISIVYRASPWIGLLTNDSSQYYWADTHPVYYTNWNQNQTQPSGTNKEYCAQIDSVTGYWNLTLCNQPNSFICKISKGMT